MIYENALCKSTSQVHVHAHARAYTQRARAKQYSPVLLYSRINTIVRGEEIDGARIREVNRDSLRAKIEQERESARWERVS